MPSSRSTLYIPLVDLSYEESQLLEVYCETQQFGETILDSKSLDKDWDFIAAPLRTIALYHDALLAVNSVRKLGLKKPFAAIYQRFKKYSWLDNQRLYSASVVNCEGESAQLGLALALLLNAAHSPIRYAIATGKLALDTGSDNDVIIESVGSLQQKLQLLIQQREHGKLRATEFLYCFTPRHYQQNGELRPVEDLAEVKILAGLDIEVKPISRLSEAAKILYADKSRYLAQDKKLLTVLGLSSSLLFGSFLYFSWLNYPITIEMVAGKQKAQPFLVCTDKNETHVRYADLQYDGSTPLLTVFSTENPQYNVGIGWKLRAEKTLWTQAYYVALIHLGEKSAYKVINHQPGSNQVIMASAGELFEWYWPMDEVKGKSLEEENILIIALQRTPIDADKINQQLDKYFSSAGVFNILQARDFLLTQFPNSYAFPYKSIFSKPPCLDALL